MAKETDPQPIKTKIKVPKISPRKNLLKLIIEVVK